MQLKAEFLVKKFFYKKYKPRNFRGGVSNKFRKWKNFEKRKIIKLVWIPIISGFSGSPQRFRIKICGVNVGAGCNLALHFNKKCKAIKSLAPTWLRGQDSNLRPLGYEPNELPTALPRDIYILFTFILFVNNTIILHLK